VALTASRDDDPVQTAGTQTLATLHHRRSVGKLGNARLAHLRCAFAAPMALDDDQSFWYFAGWHGEPFNWCEHHTDLFLPWHRGYLHYLLVGVRGGQDRGRRPVPPGQRHAGHLRVERQMK
jgi:hypothetical protein